MSEPIDIEHELVVCKRSTPGPWVVWDGCSWRRFGSIPAERTVIEPTVARHDGHPDLHMREEDAAFVVSASKHYPELLRRFKALRELPWDNQRDWTAADLKTLREALQLPEIEFPATPR